MKGSLSDWAVLSKARLQLMSSGAAIACAWMAADGHLSWPTALHLFFGLTLASNASAALNQVYEADADAQMNRTKNRPIPAGRIDARDASRFAWVSGVVGIAWLGWFLNPLTAWLAFVMFALYVWVYTPLKRVTTLNTLVGTFPGALPLLVGWAAPGNGLSMTAGILFAILYLWQLPHFMAIAWMYRKDYADGGMRMLPVDDPSGGSTARQAIQYAIALVPVSLVPTVVGLAGLVYFYTALTLSILFLAFVLRFALQRTDKRARIVLWASLVYLPLVLIMLGLDWQGLPQS